MSTTLLRRRSVPLYAFLMIGFCLPASGQTTGKDRVEDVVGARWHYEITNGTDKKPVEKGVFRVNQKIIYKGKNKVGAVQAQNQTETKLVIDGIPEINGKATLKKVGEKPPVWEGILERKKRQAIQDESGISRLLNVSNIGSRCTRPLLLMRS